MEKSSTQFTKESILAELKKDHKMLILMHDDMVDMKLFYESLILSL
tara:strand:- start:184 stop:321 length:138 start_codon:yes stop_codon:yes gene_type:complete